jgi:hypothetical protein
MAKSRRPAARPVRRAVATAPKAATSLVRAAVRTARLTLMAELRDLILTLADISEIVPHTE